MRAAGLLGVMLLIQAGCHKPVPARDVPVESERIELRVAAPGMDPAQIEAEVMQPVEAAVRSTPGLRHVTAEAGEAHARLWLEVDAAQRDAVLTDVRARLSELASTLPPDLDPPVLRVVDGPGSTFVRWAIESDTIDASMMGKLHDELVARVEQLGGVSSVQACAPRSKVVIELDPDRLRAYGIELEEIEAALRAGLSDTLMLGPAMLDINALRRVIISGNAEGGTMITLTDVAAIRYGMRESTCVAANAAGLVAAGTVHVRDQSTEKAVEQLLDSAAARFPAGARLRRFGGADTTIELSVASDRELAEVAQSIGSGLVRLAQPWLLEVGVAAEPCVGVGTRVRLSVAGSEPVSLASFQSIPGVTHVRLLDAPNERRLWLLGPDADVLHEIARQEETRLRALSSLLSVDAYTEAPRLERQIEADRDKLVRGELEVAELHDADGTSVPVMLRMAVNEDAGAIREVSVPARICRYDGQRGVLFVLQAAESSAWAMLAPYARAPLPSGYRWSWVD